MRRACAVAYACAVILMLRGIGIAQAPTPTAGCVFFYNGAGGGSNDYSLGRAATTDSGCHANWARQPTSPVIATGHAPYAVSAGGTVYVYYDFPWASPPTHLRRATSTDGGITFSNIVDLAGLPSGISFPAVAYDLDDLDPTQRWKLWYAVGTNIHYASSSDGVAFTPWSGNPVLTNNQTWKAGAAIPGSIAKDFVTGTWWLFYGGEDGALPNGVPAWLPGIAHFTNPKSVYVDDPGNPIIQRRANAIMTLAQNWNAGSTTAQVTGDPTQHFAVGETVMFSDATVNRIASMVSSGSITFRDPTAVTRAAGSDMRSQFWASVIPANVIADGVGNQRLIAVGFETYAEVGIRENCGYMIANTPTPGPTPTGTLRPSWATTSWSYDFGSSMMLEPPGGTWDGTSRENCHVIQAPFSSVAQPTATPTGGGGGAGATDTPTATPTNTAAATATRTSTVTPTPRATRTPFSCIGGPILP